MVKKTAIAAAMVVFITGSAQADRAGSDLNYGMMHWIRDTVCTPNREIVFVPVSNDTITRDASWAVIAMDTPDPDSAHVVTYEEKSWLKANGCDQDPAYPVSVADAGANNVGLAGLDL